MAEPLNTQDPEYTRQLLSKSSPLWKRLLDVQRPYRWNLRRLQLGFTLDIGCGLGRNLINLAGHGVGIDHNPESVRIAQTFGLQAFTPAGFRGSPFNQPERFDSMLLSHVTEHMSFNAALSLIMDYLPLVKKAGSLVLIAPQECGFRSDVTHVEFMDFEKLRGLAAKTGLLFLKEYSFPFPRIAGQIFKYNEFISISQKT